jgi:chromate transporter
LKIVAVAVVAQAVWGMARTLSPDRQRATLTVVTAAIVLFWPTAFGQIGAILLGAVIGAAFMRGGGAEGGTHLAVPIGRRGAVLSLTLFFALLLGLPILAAASDSMALRLFESFYRAGSLVFGGGHVVLPLLQAGVVDPGWVTRDAFVAGYGAAQAVPGPLFTFAAYLGAALIPEPNGIAGGLLCLVAIFLPSFLLVIGTLPFWDTLRRRSLAQAALRGVNAAVVGLLLAALYDPVWTSGIRAPADFALAAAALLLLAFWQLPPWLVVILTAVAGAGLAATGQ